MIQRFFSCSTLDLESRPFHKSNSPRIMVLSSMQNDLFIQIRQHYNSYVLMQVILRPRFPCVMSFGAAQRKLTSTSADLLFQKLELKRESVTRCRLPKSLIPFVRQQSAWDQDVSCKFISPVLRVRKQRREKSSGWFSETTTHRS